MVLFIFLIDSHHAQHSHLVLSKTHHLQWEEAWAIGEVQHQRLHCLEPLGTRGDRLHITVEHLRVGFECDTVGREDLMPNYLGRTLVEDFARIPPCHHLLVLAHMSWVAERVGHLLHSLHHVAIGARVRLGAILQHHTGGEDDAAALLQDVPVEGTHRCCW